MLGTNPIRPPEKGDGTLLYVQEVFPTLQGEGPYAGWPAVFIRLGGCNLACDFCDTEFESFTKQSLSQVLTTINTYSGKDTGNTHHNLVVVTGGEPFRQPITLLCEELLARGYQVQIETNGTLYRETPSQVSIICSPKNTGRGYYPLRDDLLKRTTALKFILSKSHPLYQQVGDVGQHHYNTPIYVQPMDEKDTFKNRENQQYALALAQHHGYRLSLQLHKIMDIP